MKNEEKVMFDSELAASYKTNITGWVSRNGFYFGDNANSENNARYAGCTHIKCTKCGADTKKHRLICDICIDQKESSDYESMPRQEWDGNSILYSKTNDEFYADLDSAEVDVPEGKSIRDLKLIICEPVFARTIDEDYFIDDLAEDSDLPEELLLAIKKFNDSVNGIIISWRPGKFALMEENGM